MARVKLSEFRAKNLLFEFLESDYQGVGIELAGKDYQKITAQLPNSKLYVAKVDQAVKRRGKNGLIGLKLTKEQLSKTLENFRQLGFSYALIEPYLEHQPDDEHYLAFARTSKGVEVSYSPKGGIDVEQHQGSIKKITLPEDGYKVSKNTLGLDNKFLTTLYKLFQDTHMTLLEINPLIVSGKKYIPLDAAVEVDSAAQFFVNGAWSDSDMRESQTNKHTTEQVVEELNSKTPASLSLKVLDPDGSIFLLLSGGGASVVVADELANKGAFKRIANYGEYSGNPSEDETYNYTREIINLVLNSSARSKVVIIAGGVANFTDVYKTFTGIIRAMQDNADEIRKQKVEVIVRRGGPNQEKGLKAMESFLEANGIAHRVHGPEKSLAEVVADAAKAAK